MEIDGKKRSSKGLQKRLTAFRYATAQNGLMQARDLKTAALTEGIQGIRQIKSVTCSF